MVKRHFLIVTDDSVLGRSMQDSFENNQVTELCWVSSLSQALEKVMNEPYCLLMVDLQLPGMDKSEFIVLPLKKPCNIRRFRLLNPQTVCTFPCFFPYGLKQGKVFYSPLTTLSSSRAELRFASLVEWA